MSLILAIDPGVTGALAAFTRTKDGVPYLIDVHDMPTLVSPRAKKNTRVLNLPLLADLMATPHPVYGKPKFLAIEDVHAAPGQGVTSVFSFGYTAGAIAGIAATLKIPVASVSPQVWKRVAAIPAGASGDVSRTRATQLFPYMADAFARVKDHNRAEAALIGWAAAKNFRPA